MKKILVTGTTGFIGRGLLNTLRDSSGYSITCVTRRGGTPTTCKEFVSNLTAQTDWSSALERNQTIIHAAGSAHFTKSDAISSSSELRDVNVDSTLNLARQAAEEGAKRFVFISSIGVNGNTNSQPFTENDASNPVDLYAQTKWEAEQGLWKIHRATGMEVVIIRPPLVYGPHAPGNFGKLVKLVGKRIPLPLGAVNNKRSLIALDNLVDLIITCIDHPGAANELFLAGDGEDVSTTELLRGIGKAMGKPTRLIPVPMRLLVVGATVLNKRALAQSLLGSLQVDISKARNLLGWKPMFSVDEGLRRCFVIGE
jgi:nucleoside-diphosphate-sugar epimerase